MSSQVEKTGVLPGDFPFPITTGRKESRYLTWIRNHSNYMAVRGPVDYLRAVGILVRGAIINFLIGLPYLLRRRRPGGGAQPAAGHPGLLRDPGRPGPGPGLGAPLPARDPALPDHASPEESRDRDRQLGQAARPVRALLRHRPRRAGRRGGLRGPAVLPRPVPLLGPRARHRVAGPRGGHGGGDGGLQRVRQGAVAPRRGGPEGGARGHRGDRPRRAAPRGPLRGRLPGLRRPRELGRDASPPGRDRGPSPRDPRGARPRRPEPRLRREGPREGGPAPARVPRAAAGLPVGRRRRPRRRKWRSRRSSLSRSRACGPRGSSPRRSAS